MQTKIKSELNTNFKKKGLYRRFFKRPLDFILSFIAILVLSPVLLVVALLVKTKLGSPVIFKQERPGLNEEIFALYKFRTMTDERDSNGELLSDDIRLTSFGKKLRSTSLDELPGLYNILKGDMSIIGPRPLLYEYLPYYTEIERIRHEVRPGLSGLAQISGRNNLSWDERFKKDIDYVKNISLLVDLKILFKTIVKVLKQDDIKFGEELIIKDLNIEREHSNSTNK